MGRSHIEGPERGSRAARRRSVNTAAGIAAERVAIADRARRTSEARRAAHRLDEARRSDRATK